MKQLIMLILFPAMCWGQSDKPNFKSNGAWHPKLDSTIEQPRQDTIPIIMLVCDTMKRQTEFQGWESTTPTVWWKPGFMVMEWRELWQSNNGMISFPRTPIYLDRRKKPLDSWIVIWMVKEINK